jgi:hypothetical protein
MKTKIDSKTLTSIIYCIIGILCIIGTFKLLQKITKTSKTETYNGFNSGYGCFNGKLSVPLPGKSKCFDCEREMIARDSCNINAGARGNPTMSFDASSTAESMFGTAYYGNPSRLYSPDYQLLSQYN